MIREGRKLFVGRCRIPYVMPRPDGSVEVHLSDASDLEDDGIIVVIEAETYRRSASVGAAIMGAAKTFDGARFQVPGPLDDIELQAPARVQSAAQDDQADRFPALHVDPRVPSWPEASDEPPATVTEAENFEARR